MTEENNGPTDVESEKPGPVGDGIKTEPPGNPEPDAEAVEKGQDQLERVKPY
jgi:hypothetical protein